MTEAGWLAGSDPKPMLEFLRGKASDRKLRLFAVACAKRVMHLALDQRSSETIEIAERFADGSETNRKRGNAFRHGKEAAHGAVQATQNARYAAAYAAHANASDAASGASLNGQAAAGFGSNQNYVALRQRREQNPQCVVLRDIVGSPFRPVAIDSCWLTSDVLGLARGIYEERAFDRLPILADALMDTGCDNVDVLTHCRSDGPHVRGCWVVDLILGKE